MILPLQGISLDTLFESSAHEITIDNGIVKDDMVAVVNGVGGWPENSVALHFVDRSSIET